MGTSGKTKHRPFFLQTNFDYSIMATVLNYGNLHTEQCSGHRNLALFLCL